MYKTFPISIGLSDPKNIIVVLMSFCLWLLKQNKRENEKSYVLALASFDRLYIGTIGNAFQ